MTSKAWKSQYLCKHLQTHDSPDPLFLPLLMLRRTRPVGFSKRHRHGTFRLAGSKSGEMP
eukprot:31282-Eustigmatos_ZCMA.PRE.1